MSSEVVTTPPTRHSLRPRDEGTNDDEQDVQLDSEEEHSPEWLLQQLEKYNVVIEDPHEIKIEPQELPSEIEERERDKQERSLFSPWSDGEGGCLLEPPKTNEPASKRFAAYAGRGLKSLWGQVVSATKAPLRELNVNDELHPAKQPIAETQGEDASLDEVQAPVETTATMQNDQCDDVPAGPRESECSTQVEDSSVILSKCWRECICQTVELSPGGHGDGWVTCLSAGSGLVVAALETELKLYDAATGACLSTKQLALKDVQMVDDVVVGIEADDETEGAGCSLLFVPISHAGELGEAVRVTQDSRFTTMAQANGPQQVTTGDVSGAVAVWNTASHQKLAVVQTGHGPVQAVLVMQDSDEAQLMVTISRKGVASVWLMATAECLGTLTKFSSEDSRSPTSGWRSVVQIDSDHVVMSNSACELHVWEVPACVHKESSAINRCAGLQALQRVPGQPGLVVAGTGDGYWGIFHVQPEKDDKVVCLGELPSHHTGSDLTCIVTSENFAVCGSGSGLLCLVEFTEQRRATPTHVDLAKVKRNAGPTKPLIDFTSFTSNWFKKKEQHNKVRSNTL